MEKWWLRVLWAAEDGGGSGGGEGAAPPAPATSGSVAATVDPPASQTSQLADDDIFAEFDRQTKGLEPLDTGLEPAKPAAPKTQEAPKPGEASKPAGTGNDPAKAGQPQAPEPPKLAAPPAPAPQAPPQAPQVDPTVAALMQQVAALQAQVAGAQPQPQAPQAPQVQPNRYALTMPSQLLEAMGSEDPLQRKQAFEVMANSLAETVHQTVLAEVQGKFQREWAPGLAGQLQYQQQSAQAASSYKADFYGTHRDLDHPTLYPVVQQVAQGYFRELGPNFRGYSPEVRDEVARRVRALIHGFAGAQPGVPGAVQQPAVYSGAGARPPGIQPNGAPKGPNTPDGITDFIRSVAF